MDAFVQCAGCKKILYTPEFEANHHVCMHCQHHHRITAERRIEITFDPGTFVECDAELVSANPLQFPEYDEKRKGAMAKLSQNDGIVSGTADLDGNKVAVSIADFTFMGGSMGSVHGEKITRTLERAVELQVPAIIFCASGGARMQEGLLSLMQMAKTTAAVERCREARVPYISVFTDPTMAGVLASYASIADVILSEPRALVGFAGARVSKQAGVGKVPDNFQTAEFVLEKGMIDRIVSRKELPTVLSALVRFLGGAHGR